MRLKFIFESLTLCAVLNETPTSRKLMKTLPAESVIHTWGEEVYFTVPVKTPLEGDAQQVVDPGTVCFWVEGSSLAIPFGPTPVSKADECRLVTRVNILGQLEGDPNLLKSVREGERIRVELAD